MKSENEDEIAFRKEFDGIVAASQGSEPFKPTYEDIIRFHSQATRLLISVEYYAQPLELQINQVIANGALFSFSNGFVANWMKTQDVTVLHVFPPRELATRLKEIENAEKTKARKQDHKEIDAAIKRVEPLTSKLLREVWDEMLGFPATMNLKSTLEKKKKKCKKKKNCPTESSK